jgi:hypothetical protein
MNVQDFITKYSVEQNMKREVTIEEKSALSYDLDNNLYPHESIIKYLLEGSYAARIANVLPSKIEGGLTDAWQKSAWNYYHMSLGMSKAVGDYLNDPEVIWQHFKDYEATITPEDYGISFLNRDAVNAAEDARAEVAYEAAKVGGKMNLKVIGIIAVVLYLIFK